MRIVTLAAFGFVSLFSAISAAGPEAARSGGPNHGIDVIGQADGGVVLSSHVTGITLGAGLVALWRLSPRLAVGGGATRRFTIFPMSPLGGDLAPYANDDTSLWGTTAEMRYDYAVLGPFRASLGPSLGVAFARDQFTAVTNGAVRSFSDTRIAPQLGLVTGVEIRPLKYVSIGVHGGGAYAALGSAAGGGAAIPGSAGWLYGGLDLGLHFPMN